MSERKELWRQAHLTIDALTAMEIPGPNVADVTAWRGAVRNRLRGEHWSTVVAALEDDITRDPSELAASIANPRPVRAPEPEPPNPSSLLPVVTAGDWVPLTAEEKLAVRSRINAVRDALAETLAARHADVEATDDRPDATVYDFPQARP